MARIGIDARLTYYTQGGIAQYTQHLIRAFAAIEHPHEFIIYHSRKDDRNLAEAPNQRGVTCWTPAHHRLEPFTFGLEAALRRPQLLHSPDFIPPAIAPFKSVITIHDLAFLHFPQFLTDDSRCYYNQQIDDAVRRADHIIAVSTATRQDIITRLNVPPGKITVIHEAASSVFKPASDAAVRRVQSTYNLPDRYILFVSTIEPRKNVDGLLRAYAHLRDDLPDAPPLVIAGAQGWLADDLHNLSADLNLTDAVHWPGKIAFSDLPPLYTGAQLLCLPSHYEGFGLTPLEAMACGTPVVVSNRASLPEVVADAGLHVDPTDPAAIAAAMQRLLTDTQLMQELRQRGLDRAASFSWERAARETLSVYQRVLEN